ncbi:MAG: hypothetical protein ACI85O_002641 [Saprospiraceae bacterium]|jgi:hypothetical protein
MMYKKKEKKPQRKAENSSFAAANHSSAQGVSLTPPALQFKKLDQEEEEASLQMKEGAISGSDTAGTNNGMPNDVLGKMENSFQSDFSNVNFHTSSQSATDVGALAYAQGNDVHFAPGQFKPNTQSGQELIGHELAHVVQQRQGRVQPTAQAKGIAVNDDKGLEAEADDMGKRAAQGKFIGNQSAENLTPSNIQQQKTVLQKYDDSVVTYENERNSNISRESILEDQANRQSNIEQGAQEYDGNYDVSLSALKTNIDTTYRHVISGFAAQMAVLQEAYTNMSGVLDAVNKRKQNTAAIINAFLGFVLSVGAGLAGPLMASIIGKTGLASVMNLTTATATNFNTAIGGTILSTLKGQITVAGINVPEATANASGGGHNNPEAVQRDGDAVIQAEYAYALDLVAILTNRKSDCIGIINPATILRNQASILAEKQAAGVSASAGASTKEMEKALWQSWIAENGSQRGVSGGYGVTTTYDKYHVDKEIVEHLKDDLGIAESVLIGWAGFSSKDEHKNQETYINHFAGPKY